MEPSAGMWSHAFHSINIRVAVKRLTTIAGPIHCSSGMRAAPTTACAAEMMRMRSLKSWPPGTYLARYSLIWPRRWLASSSTCQANCLPCLLKDWNVSAWHLVPSLTLCQVVLRRIWGRRGEWGNDLALVLDWKMFTAGMPLEYIRDFSSRRGFCPVARGYTASTQT